VAVELSPELECLYERVRKGVARENGFLRCRHADRFFVSGGALYAPGAERVVPHVSALNRYAVSNEIRGDSTMDAHAEDDPEFKSWPPHCVVETAAQQKPAATFLEKRVVVPNRSCEIAIEGAQQIFSRNRRGLLHQHASRSADRKLNADDTSSTAW
jgi:hypothetical protein